MTQISVWSSVVISVNSLRASLAHYLSVPVPFPINFGRVRNETCSMYTHARAGPLVTEVSTCSDIRKLEISLEGIMID